MSRSYVIDQLISAKAIAARVEELAREISTHFAGTDKLVVIGLLRGSFIFIADLVREIEVDARWIGFAIPDRFVVGYGIDYAQRNRNLPYIGSVRFTDEA